MENSRSKDPFGIVDGQAPDRRYVPEEEEERELAANCKYLIDYAHQARLPRERSWEFNRLQLRGEQYIARNESGDVLRVNFDDAQGETLPSVDNLLLPTSRAFVGKLMKIIPSIVALPRTEDRSDIKAAEVIDSFLDFQFRNLKLKRNFKRAMESLVWSGTGIWQLCWDHKLGRKLASCPNCKWTSDAEKPGNPCPLCAAQGAQSVLETVREGDMVVKMLDSRSFFPEPGVPDLEDMQYCNVRHVLPVAAIKRAFPERASLIFEQQGIYASRSLTYSIGLLNSHMDTQYLKDHAYLHEFHEAPTGEHENGRIIYMCNDRIMEVRDNPYYNLFDRFPFFIARADRLPGEFWGLPPIDTAWPMQGEHNTLTTQTRENRELTNNPKVLSAHNDGISVDRFTTVPGEVVKYKPGPGGRPAYMQPPAFANYTYTEFDRFAKSIREKFAVTEHEVGQASSDQSGRYAAMLESQASEAVAPMIVENLEEWLEMHRCIVLLGQKYYSSDRKWAINGTDRPRAYSWADCDIKAGWNLILAEEDSLSKVPALRLQQAQSLLQAGVFNDPVTGMPDIKKFRLVAGLKLPGIGPDLDASYRAYCSQVPEMMMRGIPIQPKPEDDAVIMCEELLEWLRSAGMHAPEPIVRAVRGLWFIYAQALNPVDPRAARVMPNATIGQQAPQQQQNPQQNPQSMGPGDNPAPTANPSAPQLVQQADQRAEQAAQATDKHEG